MNETLNFLKRSSLWLHCSCSPIPRHFASILVTQLKEVGSPFTADLEALCISSPCEKASFTGGTSLPPFCVHTLSLEPRYDPSASFQAQTLRKRELLLPVSWGLVLPSCHARRSPGHMKGPHGMSWRTAQLRFELATTTDHQTCE